MEKKKIERELLLKICKYYKGEDEIKTHDAQLHICWSAERLWVNDHEDNAFGEIELTAYIAAGLRDFRQTDNIPIHLKAYLFQCFCKYAERTDITEFNKFYESSY